MNARSTTMPRYHKPPLITDAQRRVFSQIVALLRPYAKRLDNRINSPERFELWTRHNFRSQSMNPKNKRGVLFGGALILKEDVGFYFYPLHLDPTFINKVDEAIMVFYKGGSAFRFEETLSEIAIEKFHQLLLEGWRYYQQNTWVSD